METGGHVDDANHTRSHFVFGLHVGPRRDGEYASHRSLVGVAGAGRARAVMWHKDRQGYQWNGHLGLGL